MRVLIKIRFIREENTKEKKEENIFPRNIRACVLGVYYECIRWSIPLNPTETPTLIKM